jgi:lysophospholipase L1-like esterase
VASKISINLDTSKENFLVAKCKQNDDLTLEAYIYGNGAELDLTNKEIIIQALKADNTYIIQNTEIVKENNKILAELDRDFSRVSGTTKIEIVLMESGKQNTTFSFYLEVSASVIKGAVESSNTVTVLEALDNKIIETGQVLAEAIQVKEDTEQLIESGGAATTGDIANINAQLEEKAQQIDLEATNARISDIVANNGNGEKDVEVVDARKGKASLRDKIDEIDISVLENDRRLNSMFDYELESLNNLTWTNDKGYYVGLSNSGFPDGTIGSKGFCSITEMNVSVGDVFVMTGTIYNAIAHYVIFDKDNKVLEIVPNYNVGANNFYTITEHKITIPEGGVKLGISRKTTDETFSLKKAVGYILKTNNKRYIKAFVPFESGKGYYVGLSGSGYPDGTLGSTSTHKAGSINVSSGEKYLLNTSVLNKMAPYVIFDKNDTVIYIYGNVVSNGVTILDKYEIIIPEGGVKLGISCYIQNAPNFMLLKETNEYSINVDSIEYYSTLDDSECGILTAKPAVKVNNQIQEMKFVNLYKYPFLPTWGHEYLSHWYEKIYNANAQATLVLEGDSITEGYDPLYSGVNDAFKNMRGYHIKKIMKIGNYPLQYLNLVNNGHGGRNTNEYVGNATYGNPGIIASNINGFIDTGMSNNPDLLIIAYGMNDADSTNTYLPKTIEERVKLYELNMREALQRIRGNVSINGRPAYNKPLKDLSIIICNPTVSYKPTTSRSNDLWNQYVRIINQKLCREFYCAFCDLTFRTYDHKADGSNDWSVLESSGAKGWIHPNKYSDAQITSLLQDLIYPMALWNVSVE